MISRRFSSITNSYITILELHESEINLSKINIYDLPSSCQARQLSVPAQEQKKQTETGTPNSLLQPVKQSP